MYKEFKTPEIIISRFDSEDIVTDSGINAADSVSEQLDSYANNKGITIGARVRLAF